MIYTRTTNVKANDLALTRRHIASRRYLSMNYHIIMKHSDTDSGLVVIDSIHSNNNNNNKNGFIR